MSTAATNKWSLPQDVDPITQAFPAQVIGKLLPEWDEIPKDFQEEREAAAPWIKFVRTWFFEGLDKMEGVRPSDALIDSIHAKAKADGVEEDVSKLIPMVQEQIDKAFKHLGAIQGSFEPKHEHKEAGVAWLASLWFDEVVWK